MLHYFLDSIGVEVVYLWVPAHCGIKGNEIADTLARIAPGRMESHHLDPSTITRSEANLELPLPDTKLMINNYCISLWQKHYESISTGFQYKQCFPSVRNLNILNSSQIFRLQTGHCRLNKHMHRIGLHPTGLCSTCSIPEDVHHFIFICTKYLLPRSILQTRLQSLNVNFSFPSIFCVEAVTPLLNFTKSSQREI